MKPIEIFKTVNDIKPSILDNSALLSFLNTVEAKLRKIVHDEKIYTPIPYEEIETAELLLEEEHKEIYLYYLASQIDYFINDIDSYNNSVELYNKALETYTRKIQSRKEKTPIYKYDYEGAFK